MAMNTINAADIDWRKLMDEDLMQKIHPVMTVHPSHNHGGMLAGNNSVSDHTHSYSNAAMAASQVVSRWSEQNLLNMLGSRMAWGVEGKCPFQRVVPWKVTDKVVVFVVMKDDAVMINDDANLYPSDALITQIRILAEAL